jgi:hypothetical protein
MEQRPSYSIPYKEGACGQDQFRGGARKEWDLGGEESERTVPGQGQGLGWCLKKKKHKQKIPPLDGSFCPSHCLAFN